jgi:exonuclease SbcC
VRLHRLEIEAFGPFGGHEEVDFDALSDSGLFLLSGPTGAGKTSVLDAICFALFGEVPGARGDAGRLASDHRAADATPRVTLEATVGGRRIRVARVPPHLRPRKRGGDGDLVAELASAVLEVQATDGAWQAVAAKVQDVKHELDPLLGMTAEQFLQVVMLPQGAFATFLRADAKARQGVLERLFDAGRFSRMELWLQDRAREARAAVEAAQHEADNALSEGCGAWSAPEPPPKLREGATTDDVDAWLTAERERLAADRAAADRAREEAAAALRAAELERDEAREHADRQRRRREAEARLAEIEAHAAEHEERVARLRAHHRAAPLRGYLDGVRATRARAQDTERTMVKARGWIAALEDEALSAEPETWAAGARRRADEAASLGDLVAAEAALTGRTSELQRLRGAARSALDEATAAEERLRGAESAAAALEERRARAATAATEAAALSEQAAAAAARADAGTRRDELTARATRAADAVRAAVDAHQAATDHVQRLRHERLEGYAAELAAGLGPDDACPVCGATEHPAPATPGDGHVTAEQERTAAAQADAARVAREAAEREAGELQAALAAARQAAGGPGSSSEGDVVDVPTDALRAEAATLAERLRTVRAAAADGEHAAAERRELDARVEQDRRTLSAARDRAAALGAQADGLESELALLRERITTARGDFPDVAARVAGLKHEATFLEKATAAHEAHVAAVAAQAEADAALAAALREQEVTDADAAAAAIMAPREVQALEAQVREVDEARSSARGVLAVPEIAATALEPPVDLPKVEAARAAAAKAAEEAATEAASVARCADGEAERREALRAALDALAPLMAAADRARELSELARGGTGNRRRIQLSSWVLAARLEQVAAAATVHLLQMSAGRYALVLHEEPATGRGKGNAGLGLRVRDGWTGEERDTSTLSGGESFFASLSLALGLAETVSAEAGGLDLGTLFIDEGFGTLDEQTLDEVLGVLDDLRDGGRAVGIVSHVPELKQRVPMQLTVEKAREGSRLRQGTVAGV